MSRRLGADVVFDYSEVDVLTEVKRLTGVGVDGATEALGTQETFESALSQFALRRHAFKLGCILG